MRAHWLLLFFQSSLWAWAATLRAEASGIPLGGIRPPHGSELEAGTSQANLELAAAPAGLLLDLQVI